MEDTCPPASGYVKEEKRETNSQGSYQETSMISLVIEHAEEYSCSPGFPMRTGINVLCARSILALCFKTLCTERDWIKCSFS